MPHRFDVFNRLPARIFQVLAAVAVSVILALIIALGVANVQLARIQQSLAPVLEHALEQQLGRGVRVGDIRLSGLGRLDITDTTVAKGATFAEGSALIAPRVSANVNLLSLLINKGENPVKAIRRITLIRPTLTVHRSQDGQWDFQDVADRLFAKKPSIRALRAHFVVSDGRITYADERGFSATPESLRHDIVKVQARVTPQWNDTYAFNITGKDTDTHIGDLHLAGCYSNRTGSAQVSVKANHVAAREIARFLPAKLPLTFDSGVTAIRLSALFRTLPNPEKARSLSPAELTAEVDLAGIGIRLDELTAPIIATSGRLRLVHDGARYPKGSRLALRNVRARAGNLPIRVTGNISEINLFDMTRLQPVYDLHLAASTRDGKVLRRLFAKDEWPKGVTLSGHSSIDTRLTGRGAHSRITGSISAEHIAIAGIHGEGAKVRFHLLPFAVRESATVNGSLGIKRATVNDLEISNIAASLTSVTPWDALDEQPEITGELLAGQIRHPWGTIEQLHGRYIADREALRATTLKADILRGQVTGALTIPFTTEEKARLGGIHGNGSFTDVNLQSLGTALNLARFTGNGNGSFTLSTSQGRLTLAGKLDARDLQFRDYRASRILSDFTITQDTNNAVTIGIPSAVINADIGTFRIADGAYVWSGGSADAGTLLLPVEGDAIPLQRIADQELTGTAHISGRVTGSLASPRLDGHLTARDGAYQGRIYQLAEGDVTWIEGGTRLRNVIFSKPGMALHVTGKDGTDIDLDRGLTGIAAHLTLDGASAHELFALIGRECPWPIDGKTRGEIDFHYLPNGLVAEGTIAIPDAVVRIPRDDDPYPLALDLLSLTFSYDAGSALVQDLSLTRGTSTVHVTGTADCRQRDVLLANLSLHGEEGLLQEMPLDLFGIPLALRGPVSFHGTLKGELGESEVPEALAIRLSAMSPAMRVEGFPVGNGKVDLTYAIRNGQRELTIHDGTINGDALSLTSTGQYLLSRGEMDDVSVSLKHFDLGALRSVASSAADDVESGILLVLINGLPDDIAGQGQGHLSINGNFAHPSLATDFTLTHLGMNHTALPDIRAKLSAAPTNGRYAFHIDEVTAHDHTGRGHASLRGDIDTTGHVNLRFLADVSASYLAALTDIPSLGGHINLDGTINGPWKRPAVDTDIALEQPAIAGFTAHRVAGHLRLADERIIVSRGQAWLTPNSPPMVINGEAPVHWDGVTPSIPEDRPLSLAIDVPRQSTAFLDPLLPGIGIVNGNIAGALRIGGTIKSPRLTGGRLALDGSADLPVHVADLPNRLNDIDLRLRATMDGSGSVLTIDRFSATLDRMVGATREKGFQPGWIATEGSVRIPHAQLLFPQRWQWDVYANILRAPLSQPVTMVPSISGFLHLESDAQGPVLKGVLLAEHTKLKEPKETGGTTKHLGPFLLNPRLSIVLQLGEGMRIAKSIFRIPLKSTPLPWPSMPEIIPGVQPSMDIAQDNPAYRYHAGMLKPDSRAELPGTWGVITGSFEDPRLYARFEVHKEKVGFPLNLFSSVRKAKGHVTYALADGPRVVMGIPDFPAPSGKTTASMGKSDAAKSLR